MSYSRDQRKDAPSLFKIGIGLALVAGLVKLAKDDEFRDKVGNAIEEGATKFGKWLDEKTAPQPQRRALTWDGDNKKEEEKKRIKQMDTKRGEIVVQQKLIKARRQELVKIRQKAIEHHEWKKDELEKRLLKRGIKSIVRHIAFHAVGSFAGTALALSMDAADAAGYAADVADAGDAVDAIAASLDALPDFDAFSTMQTTWEQMGDMDLIDIDDVDFSDASDFQDSYDEMNDRFESLQTCNQGFVDAANQNYSAFSQYGDMDIFQDSQNNDLLFGSSTDSRFDTQLKGPNGEDLTCTADDHYLIKGTTTEVPYSQTKAP